MRQLFNPESFLWKPFGYLGELVILSLLWTVFSLPLVTLGPASAALYDTAVRVLRRREDGLFPRFFSTFRRELKEGVLSTLVWLAGLTALGLGFYAVLRFVPAAAENWPPFLALALVLGFFALGILCWVFPILSRFTLDLSTLHQNALRLAFGNILRTAVMALIWGGTIAVGLRYVAPLFVLPALSALLSSFLIEPVFRKYEEA